MSSKASGVLQILAAIFGIALLVGVGVFIGVILNRSTKTIEAMATNTQPARGTSAVTSNHTSNNMVAPSYGTSSSSGERTNDDSDVAARREAKERALAEAERKRQAAAERKRRAEREAAEKRARAEATSETRTSSTPDREAVALSEEDESGLPDSEKSHEDEDAKEKGFKRTVLDTIEAKIRALGYTGTYHYMDRIEASYLREGVMQEMRRHGIKYFMKYVGVGKDGTTASFMITEKPIGKEVARDGFMDVLLAYGDIGGKGLAEDAPIYRHGNMFLIFTCGCGEDKKIISLFKSLR